MEQFLHKLKAVSAGVFKRNTQSSPDGTDRKRVNTYEAKPRNAKCIKKYCIVLTYTIEKYLKIDIANHVAYATYATT